MARIKRSGLTEKGKELITREIAGSTELTFTKVSASDSKIADTTKIDTLITLDGIKQTINVSTVEKISANQVKVTAAFNNSGLLTGYSMETLGIYARDTQGTEVLFAVTVASVADFMPATNGINLSTVTVEMLFNLSNTDNVSMSVDAEALATTEMLNVLKTEVKKDYVKYTDLATDMRAGIMTLNKVREIAPKPDLSPYIPFEKGYRNNNMTDYVIRANLSDLWAPRHLHMYLENGDYMGTFHVNGVRAYYKVPSRNGGNWCEIMDNHDMATRDSSIQHAHNRITDTWNHASDAWSKAHDAQNNRLHDVRLVGYLKLQRYNNLGKERGGYVMTGLETQLNNNDFWIEMRALQFLRGGVWFNVPFG